MLHPFPARYLVSLGAADVDLIQQHSKWVLKADPEAGLQAFLQMRPPLNPSMVRPKRGGKGQGALCTGQGWTQYRQSDDD